MHRRVRRETGSTLLELLMATTILLVIAGAAVTLFTANLKRYASEQQTAEMNQAARNALNLMSLEIQQAGSHAEVSTTAPNAITGSTSVQTITLASTANLNVGDWLTVDPGASSEETFQVTAIGNNTLSGKIKKNHLANAPVCLFAEPYVTGILPPTVGGSTLGPNASATTNSIRFYGDINGDGSLYYIEYLYNPAARELTRSMTPLSASIKAAAVPLSENVTGLSFTHYTDNWGAVTKVLISIRVSNADPTQPNQITLANTVMVRSVVAASSLAARMQQYVMPNILPPTPAAVTTWSH